jgi:hypothetical protein
MKNQKKSKIIPFKKKQDEEIHLIKVSEIAKKVFEKKEKKAD